MLFETSGLSWVRPYKNSHQFSLLSKFSFSKGSTESYIFLVLFRLSLQYNDLDMAMYTRPWLRCATSPRVSVLACEFWCILCHKQK